MYSPTIAELQAGLAACSNPSLIEKDVMAQIDAQKNRRAYVQIANLSGGVWTRLTYPFFYTASWPTPERPRGNKAYYVAAGVMAQMNYWADRRKALAEYDKDPNALIARVKAFASEPVSATAISEVFEEVRRYETA